MTTVATIDVRGLDHAQREALIFPALDKLRPGQSLRLVLEFNPVPLVYLLKARNELEIAYEKKGPPDWILTVARISPVHDKKEELRAVLQELKGDGASEETKKKAKDFLASVDAKTLGLMEQELIREGVSHEEVRQSLCDIHLEALKDSLVANLIEVSAPHPVHTFMEEHQVILRSLEDLSVLLADLKTRKNFAEFGPGLERLKVIAHHLVEAENHHQREEEALFPAIQKHDIVEPPNIMRMDHVEFRKRKKELYQIAHNPVRTDFTAFGTKVAELGGYLSRELTSHIFKENNILYQIALQVLTPKEWDGVKTNCDKIGYCCFTPVDAEKSPDVVELDLRPLHPFERHDRIFALWNALKPGQTLRLTNDHNPKPLRYQFEAEQKGLFEWTSVQEGPKDWIFAIRRVKS